MSDRRHGARPDASDRRTFPRPPLWLNLLLLLLGVAGLLYARYHRERVSERYAHVIAQEARTPDDLRKLKSELAEMDVSREQLQSELQSRMKLVAGLKSEDFYLSIDTEKRKLRFYYGDKVLREAPVTIGDHTTIKAGERSWTFVPLKGSFPIEAKVVDHEWQVPEWVYAMNQQPIPAARPTVPGGLGKYALFLPNGYVIHTQPSEASPLKGAKPGSFMVPEEDLRAIWPRIHREKTQVYIY
jgi:hypothetical protein